MNFNHYYSYNFVLKNLVNVTEVWLSRKHKTRVKLVKKILHPPSKKDSIFSLLQESNDFKFDQNYIKKVLWYQISIIRLIIKYIL